MSYSNNKTSSKELTFEQIQELVERLPLEEKIIIAKKLSKETLKNRLKSFNKELKVVDLSDEDIINEVKSVRKGIYENKGKSKISN